ncbi:MAG: serine/threonine protein kinase [Kofleriaceae bacterium]|nr:MAG: serine/threonine protein kinase [Kofleriaceae bacterium]MBZ0235644.1 serine/threonine protein kinase [Kofleriaceae bacterium]
MALSARSTPASDSGEEARAFLQARLALYWKVLFFIMLVASGLALAGAWKRIGGDLVMDLLLAVSAAGLWWVCRRGAYSLRFLRWFESLALLLWFSCASLLPRYTLVGFAEERRLATAEGALYADAYLSILGMVGVAMWVSLRAALVPSSPWRTIAHTAMVGVPTIVTPSLVMPDGAGGLTLRPLDSAVFPWMPAALIMVWFFVMLTCAVISKVIYGLRAEIREARRLGQYVLERKIGEGGMGEVYRARHGMMRRPTALKLLRADQAAESKMIRFEREVQLTARLTHPNTITIFDYGRTDDGIFYYAMELLDGANLQRVVDVGGAQPEARVVRILTMACGALAEAHAIGLIHRDIKPANIMLCSQGGERDVVKLLDFGLVKELAIDGDAKVSVANTLTGTPQYMAPESIVDADSADPRADLYALGAVAYFLLAGGEVFRGKSVVEVCSQHLHQPPEPFAARGVTVSAELEAIVLACLEKDPARRPQSALELRRRLEACAVEPWGDEHARQWWLEHQAALAGDAAPGSGVGRTIAVDASRS